MEISLLFLAQCAALVTALGANDPPPLPSYNYGITGEPRKVDTAFGNLGVLGPVYDVPQIRNDTSSSGGDPQQAKTNETIHANTTTRPAKIPSQRGTSNSSNVEEITTLRTTGGEEDTSESSPLPLRTTLGTSTEGIKETGSAPNSTQIFELTTVSKEPSSTIAGNNNSTNTVNSTINVATNTMAPANTPSWKPASTLPPRVTPTPEGTPSQTFHTGSPSSTDIPIKLPPGRNETKPSQNLTAPSKPNSSMPIYLNGNICLILAVFSVFYITDIKGNY